jgi:serine/threonine-protein kinase RsbW
MVEENNLTKLLDKDTIEVSLPSELGYERIAMECSASFAKIVGFAPERIEDLKTAVSEACINAMEHGNKHHPDNRVVIKMNYSDNVLTVSVMDQGDGLQISFDEMEPPDITKKINNLQTPRGLGLFLIKQLMDQVEFNKVSNEGHIIRMVLKLIK